MDMGRCVKLFANRPNRDDAILVVQYNTNQKGSAAILRDSQLISEKAREFVQ